MMMTMMMMMTTTTTIQYDTSYVMNIIYWVGYKIGCIKNIFISETEQLTSHQQGCLGWSEKQ